MSLKTIKMATTQPRFPKLVTEDVRKYCGRRYEPLVESPLDGTLVACRIICCNLYVIKWFGVFQASEHYNPTGLGCLVRRPIFT